jgi:formylglycine-generating enzyme required for sulfatase activity
MEWHGRGLKAGAEDGYQIFEQRRNLNNFIFLRSPAAKSNFKYATGSFRYTSPGGNFDACGYGWYDMIGNVFE